MFSEKELFGVRFPIHRLSVTSRHFIAFLMDLAPGLRNLDGLGSIPPRATQVGERNLDGLLTQDNNNWLRSIVIA